MANQSPKKPQRSAPLSPDERRAILDALTAGGRSMRSVAEDDAIRGTMDQIRAVVEEAIRDDPSLLERHPHLSRRDPADLLPAPPVERSGTVAPRTAAEALTLVGVPPDTLLLQKAVTTTREVPHFLRKSDGSFEIIMVPHTTTRSEWRPAEEVRPMHPALEIPAQVLPLQSGRGLHRDPKWLRAVIVVLLLLLVLVVLGAVASGRGSRGEPTVAQSAGLVDSTLGRR